MMKITPMFCKPLIEVNIDIDTIDMEKNFFKLKFEKHNNTDECELTVDMNIINKPNFKKLKNIIDKVVVDVNSNVWKINKKLNISTSWLTKTHKNGESALHNHLNSLYSGVFYFQDSSPITFTSFRSNTIYDPPYENNVYNSEKWTIHPKKNTLILFSSEVPHLIEKNKNEKLRYSLAFNLLPKGILGYKDSTIKIG